MDYAVLVASMINSGTSRKGWFFNVQPAIAEKGL
jgi:hypothetical protein